MKLNEALVVSEVNGYLDLGANTFTLNTFNHANATITIGSAIMGAGAIIKTGGGGARFNGANSYGS